MKLLDNILNEKTVFSLQILGVLFLIFSGLLSIIVSLNTRTICPAYINDIYVDTHNKIITGKCMFDANYESYLINCTNNELTPYKKTYWYEYNSLIFNSSKYNSSIPFQKKVI